MPKSFCRFFNGLGVSFLGIQKEMILKTEPLLTSLLLIVSVTVQSEITQPRFIISIPTLAVAKQGQKSIGGIAYLVVQGDPLEQPVGPQIQFNEGSRALGVFKGSALGPQWKEAARVATVAAARLLGEDPRTWLVTIKEVSTAYKVDGPSASAPLAVALVAGKRGVTLLPGMALSGAIDAEGRILAVGALSEKVQGAAAAGFSTILIPAGQMRTPNWDLSSLSQSLGVTIIEVSTLKEAYERMTGHDF